MFRIPCPNCGPRNRTEFRHVGERTLRPDPASVTSAQWRSYLYDRDNLADWTTETWYHTAGCRKFVTVERDTVSNQIRTGHEASASTDAEPGHS